MIDVRCSMLIQGKRGEPPTAMPEARGQPGPAAAAAVYKHAPMVLSYIYAHISICLMSVMGMLLLYMDHVFICTYYVDKRTLFWTCDFNFNSNSNGHFLCFLLFAFYFLLFPSCFWSCSCYQLVKCFFAISIYNSSLSLQLQPAAHSHPHVACCMLLVASAPSASCPPFVFVCVVYVSSVFVFCVAPKPLPWYLVFI